MTNAFLPLGKLPPALLEKIIANAPLSDPRVTLGPGVGLDCAIIDAGESMWALKSDPITFATDEIGWYAVQISANDIATTGALPRWYLATVLLPEKKTTEALALEISGQLFAACRALNISFIGGHTEITHGIDRPIIMGTLIGEVAHEKLITPRGAKPGDLLLLTKGVPIEATSLLAREFPQRLEAHLEPGELAQAAAYLHNPGISILSDAQIALGAGRVTAMHDPTEGGLAAALWEMSKACGYELEVNLDNVIIPDLSRRVCQVFGLNPLATIASGALLLSVEAHDAQAVLSALSTAGIACSVIGSICPSSAAVWQQDGNGRKPLPYPERDEITKAFE